MTSGRARREDRWPVPRLYGSREQQQQEQQEQQEQQGSAISIAGRAGKGLQAARRSIGDASWARRCGLDRRWATGGLGDGRDAPIAAAASINLKIVLRGQLAMGPRMAAVWAPAGPRPLLRPRTTHSRPRTLDDADASATTSQPVCSASQPACVFCQPASLFDTRLCYTHTPTSALLCRSACAPPAPMSPGLALPAIPAAPAVRTTLAADA
ncbi:hypothetical protein C7974DRAFT_438894 [Boeremia exigua]|uniref:uncharacterized protein n=1 Tax=Boeremia exigua TaxID=749465 RepID=UPI001E8D8C89|nr:uncharacterized protein C7974DRAFT_438894 [Boeremia exigua]KAH6643858.1 hypothetical protein C7974DRAFT_438894 [Boeremia exigua]